MHEMSGKRVVDRLTLTKGSGLVMRDTSSFSGCSTQPCTKLGCGSRLNMMKAGQGGGAGCPQKAKSVRSALCHSGGKEVMGSSSKNGSSSLSAMRKPKKEAPKKIALRLDTESSETSSVRDELEVPEVASQAGKVQKGLEESSMNGVTEKELGSSSSGPASISASRNRSISNNLGSSKAKSVRQQPTIPNTAPCGLRNPRCNVTSDAVPSSSNLLLNRSPNKRKDLLKGRISKGETSSSRVKKTDETLPSSRSALSISESRRTRNRGPPEFHRSVPSVGARRSPVSPSMRNTRSTSMNESQFTFTRLTRRDLPADRNSSSSSSSYESSSESLFRCFASNGLGSSSGRTPVARPTSPESEGITSHSLINWESLRDYTMEGIAEVLSTLQRIERDELDYEHLASLDTNLFISSLNVYDQHRDMRMDIENMSYEELLALEERMGTVSTALPEEALSKCIKRDSYTTTKCDDEFAASIENDETKCSICQEEYADEDEIGRLKCEHMYHVDCINQWLRLKNWCPICKGSLAEPSPSSPRP